MAGIQMLSVLIALKMIPSNDKVLSRQNCIWIYFVMGFMVCGQLTGFYFLNVSKMSPSTQLPLQPPPRHPNEVMNAWF